MENSDKVIDGLQLIFVELPKFTPHIGYEKFWDIISVEKTLYYSAEQRGLAKGIEKGIAEGIEKGLAEGEKKKQREIAENMKSFGIAPDIIVQTTGLSLEEINLL